MRVCLILEGSYPYVHGGVSTWMHQYIQEMPEIEFVLWTICAKEENKGNFVYELPKNVVQVVELSLETSQPNPIPFDLKQLSPEEMRQLRKLVALETPDWKILFELCQSQRIPVPSFLESKIFFDWVQDMSRELYPNLSLAELFHSRRSILFPLLNLLASPIPEAHLYHAISTGYGGILASLGSHMKAAPLLLTEHGIYTREREEELLRASWLPNAMKEHWIRFFHLLSGAIYQRAQTITSLFDAARLIQIQLGCPEERCRVIANGIDVPKFAAIAAKPSSDWLDIGAIIRLSPIKDVKTLLYAFMELSQDFPRARLHILGGEDDPEYAQECYDLVKKLDLKQVRFTGRVSIIDYMAKLDLTVLTSLSEAQPLSLLEAMAAGRPCVATDVGSCRELLQGGYHDSLGYAGLVVKPTDTSGLARALAELLKDPNRRAEMGRVGKLRAQTYYQYPQMIEAYARLYKECI